MGTFRSAAAGVLCIALIAPGCATTPGGKGVTWSSPEACIATYTVGGVAAGAVIGKLLGGDTKDAAAGAVAGGVLAFAYAWGKCFADFSTSKSQPAKGYDDTARQVRYAPDQGTVVKITNYHLDPVAAAPGDTVKFRAGYYVMTPARKDVSVTETRTLKFFDRGQNKYVEYPVPEKTVISPGLRNADGSVPIPDNAQEGEFILAFKVEAEGKTASREVPFVITRDSRALTRARERGSARETADEGRTGEHLAGQKSFKTGEKFLRIIQEKVNLRSEPDAESRLLGTAGKNERFPLLQMREAQGRRWYQIGLGSGRTAWLVGTAAKVEEP